MAKSPKMTLSYAELEQERNNLKKLVYLAMIFIIIISSLLIFNMLEVKKYKHINTGNYITIEDCDASKTQWVLNSSTMINNGITS